MLKKTLALSWLMLIIQWSQAQISELPLNNPESAISFSVGFAGGITSIEGRFDKFSGTIGYKNPNDLTTLYADVTIEVASINTGDKERDADLMAAGFFDQAQFPEITFKSEKVERRGNGLVMIGAFTMLGKTIDLEIPFERTHPEPLAWVFGEPRIAVKGQVTLDRIEFGIPKRGWDNMLPSLGSMTLSKEVNISLSIMGMGEGVSGMMTQEAMADGAQAAIKKYESLQKEWGSRENTYSFGGRTLVGVTLTLIRDKRSDLAIEIGKYAIQTDPENFLTYYALAEAYQAGDDKPNAIKNFQKALDLNPNFGRAKQALEALKK